MNFRHFLIFVGLRLSSQLTKSYFSEGWPNHQTVMFCGFVASVTSLCLWELWERPSSISGSSHPVRLLFLPSGSQTWHAGKLPMCGSYKSSFIMHCPWREQEKSKNGLFVGWFFPATHLHNAFPIAMVDFRRYPLVNLQKAIENAH